jgi:S1-C subfamily serine protease
MTSAAFAAARVARPPPRVNNGGLVPGARSRGKPSPARGAPARVRAEASASSDATASSRPPASSLSRRAALAAATASVASRAFVPNPDAALALVDDANAQRVFETAARSVVALADYVEGGPNGGYTPRGTAVVWSEFADGGFVITDFHVVAPYVARSAGASSSKKQSSSPGSAMPPSARLRVNVPDARTGDAVWYEAQVVGTQRASDVAVLRLTSPEVRGAVAPRLTAMAVGSSDDLLVGQSCYAVGAGDTDDVAGARTSRQRTTMSAGVVSGLRRSVPSKNGTTIRNVIQTDAKVPESSAGGALVDSSGRLVGMTVTTYGSVSPGLSFAVPVDDLLKIVPSLITLHQIS